MDSPKLFHVIFRPAIAVIFALLCMSGAHAQYSLTTFCGKVEVKHAGRIVPVRTGMQLSAADLIIIGQGGSVEVLDKRDSKLYFRDTPGEIGLTSLIFEAKKSAGSNAGAVHRKVALGKTSEEEGRMYVEKGKITLALEEYDPAGEEFMIDAKVMARYIAGMLKAGIADSLQSFPTVFEYSSEPKGSLMFRIDNTVSEPLYINVIKLTVADGGRQFRISELGQPVGCYVLLPRQSIMRSQSDGIKEGEMHLVVATHYYFSIDELIAELAAVLNDNPPSESALLNLPIYIRKI